MAPVENVFAARRFTGRRKAESIKRQFRLNGGRRVATSTKRLIRRSIAAAGPVVGWCAAKGWLDRGAHGFSFLDGFGAGSGWDAEAEAIAAAALIQSSDPVIFDVGANRGVWSQKLAANLGSKRGRYFLFEVAPYCFEPLRAACDALGNATIIPLAVGDKPGTASFYKPEEFSGLASLHERRDVGVRQRTYDVMEVECVTLDAFVEKQGIDTVAFAKFDIEGHELFALKGASNLLAAQRITALQFEFGSANVNSRTFFRDFWDLLKGNGYNIYRVIPGGGRVEIERYSERLEYFHSATNYLAVAA